MSSKPYDQAFKFLAEQDAAALLVILGVIPPDAEVTIVPLPREISAPALATDQGYRIISEGEEFIAHLEAQIGYDYEMPQRMPEYAVLYWLKYRLPIVSYLLMLTDRNLPSSPPTTGVITAGGTQITTSYRIIRVWEISAADALATGSDAILPFVPLMDGGRAELEAGARALRDVSDERLQREMALHFVVLGALRYNSDELMELIGRATMIPLEQLKESSFYQLILQEGEERGLEKGLKALADVFRHLAAIRFPGIQLGDEVEAIGDLDKLRDLCNEIEKISDEATLRHRLAELAVVH